MFNEISLPLISFAKKLVTAKMMTYKKIETTYVNKGNDKIVIAQLTHNTSIGPITCVKAKSIAPSAKLANEHTRLLKLTRTCDNYRSFITLASLGAKGQNLRLLQPFRLFYSSSFSVTMSIMTTSTTFVKKQLVETTLVITKLTKTIKEKDLQIVSLMNKVEA